jgi:flagellar biosynthesis GTPase FlhF
VEVVSEDLSEIFKILVREEKRMAFLAARNSEENGDAQAGLAQPEEPVTSERRTDLHLQTSYTPTQLQSRLLATYHAAKTSLEEQGVNTLYLALGMLRWFEDDNSEKEHRAPLMLIPVELQRGDARERFRLSYTGEDIAGNVSLAEKLETEYGIKRFPELPDSEDLDVQSYLREFERLIERRKGWAVETQAIALGFFSFAKLLMYRDLDPSTWKTSDGQSGLLGHEILNLLLGEEGFAQEPSRYCEERLLDEQLSDRNVFQVVDADSSQTLAVLDALDGRNMLIQGPPGTGKSQTIVNLIAAALAEGKKVLFVAEKMAALDVVKRRLDAAGLGGPCLVLHGSGASERTRSIKKADRGYQEDGFLRPAGGRAKSDGRRAARQRAQEAQ